MKEEPSTLHIRLLAAGALLLAGCSEVGAPGGGSTAVEELAPIPIVEELRIGSVEDPSEGFSRISDVLAAPDGTVLVLEGAAGEVRSYDADGRLIRTFGGRGEGPGEFERPGTFGLVDDTLWVSDSGNDRITLFTLDGAVAATLPQRPLEVPSDAASMRVSVVPSAYLGGGRYSSAPRVSFRGATTGAPDSIRVPSVLFDMQGAVLDTVGWSVMGLSADVISRDGSMLILRNPLDDAPLRGAFEGDRVIVDRSAASTEGSGGFKVSRVDTVGDTVFSRAFTYRPRRVTAAFMDSLVESHVENLPASWDRSGWESAVRDALPDLDHHPPVTDYRVGEDGSVWLRLDQEDGGSASWLVVRPDGTAAGIVSLPGDAEIEWSADGVIWTVEEDELDVPWLVRYRLSPGG